MAYKTFISFSYTEENHQLKNKVANFMSSKGLALDYSEKEDRSDTSEENIWRNLHSKIKSSSVTLLLFTDDLLYENSRKMNQGRDFMDSGWIYKELSCSLRDWEENRINGILVLDCTSNQSLRNSAFKKDNHILWNNINNHRGIRKVSPLIDMARYDQNKSFVIICNLSECWIS